MYCPNHMSSVLHLYAYVCAAALFANIANCLFSKSFEQFAPEERVEIVIKNNICLNKFTFLSRDCFEFPKKVRGQYLLCRKLWRWRHLSLFMEIPWDVGYTEEPYMEVRTKLCSTKASWHTHILGKTTER